MTAYNFSETTQNLIANEYCNLLIQVLKHAVRIKALMINSVILLYTKPDFIWYKHFFYVDEFAVWQTEKNRRCLAARQR